MLDKQEIDQLVDIMKKSGHQFWLTGKAHCIACNFEMILVAPYPTALDPNGECKKCGAFLVVYDDAENMKVKCAKDKRLSGL